MGAFCHPEILLRPSLIRAAGSLQQSFYRIRTP